MPELVKGAGFNHPGGNTPLSDDDVINKRSFLAEKALRDTVRRSAENPGEVLKGLNAGFLQQHPLFVEGLQMSNGLQQLTSQLNEVLSGELGKNITLTSPLSTGFVPFNLAAPSRLIYPVYSPLRNKIPRVAGMGTSHRAKLITGISGSQTGGATISRISLPELVQNGGSLSNWPNNLPPAGSQTAVDMNIPYKFFGLSESLSFLAQFAGQGFEDIMALANLILLQESMLLEEYQIVAGTGTAIPTPAACTTAARTAGSNETTLSGITTNLYVRVTARNYYGETVSSTVATQVWSAGQVVDVTIAPSRGALTYNVYVGTGASDPGVAGSKLMVTGTGATKVTLQGAIPTATATPPTADTGTSSTNDYEGILSILDGHAVTDAAVYPAGFQGGYVNKSVGQTLNYNTINAALTHMWDGTATSAEGFRADPRELIAEGSDIKRLSDDIINSNAAGLNYRLSITQDEQGGVRAGAAVSEFQNPITRSLIAVVVHPWLTQGTAFLKSYTLPRPQTNVANIWENVLPQDYMSINWPVIDASHRFSILWYGSLVCYAPQYNGVLQGLQQSASTPYS